MRRSAMRAVDSRGIIGLGLRRRLCGLRVTMGRVGSRDENVEGWWNERAGQRSNELGIPIPKNGRKHSERYTEQSTNRLPGLDLWDR
jgi:hypothetical protein